MPRINYRLWLGILIIPLVAGTLTFSRPQHEKKESPAPTQVSEKEKSWEKLYHELYLKAKQAIYRQQWSEAATTFQQLAFELEKQKKDHLDESLFWLSYSLDKLADQIADVEKELATRQHAFQELEKIISDFPHSQWADDAQLLQIKIARELAEQGLEEYLQYLNTTIEGVFQGVEEGGEEVERVEKVRVGVGVESEVQGVEGVGKIKVKGERIKGEKEVKGVQGGVERKVGQEIESNISQELKKTKTEAEKIQQEKLLQEEKKRKFQEKRAQEKKEEKMKIFIPETPRVPEVTPPIPPEAIIPVIPTTPLFPEPIKIEEIDPELEIKIVALDALMDVAPEKAFPVLEKIFKEDIPSQLQERAIFILAQTKDSRAIPIMVDLALHSNNPRLQKGAVFWLGQRQEKKARQALLSLYDQLSNEKQKGYVLFSLARSRDKTARKKLLEIIRTEKSHDLKEMAILSLRNTRDPEVTEALLNLLDETKDLKLKERLIFTLSTNARNNERFQKKLISLLQKEQEPRLRELAILHLGRFAGDEAIPVLKNFYSQLKEKDAQLKKRIIFSLGNQIKNPEAVKALIEIARQEKDPEIRKQVVYLLRDSKNEEAIKFLEEIINR